MGKFGCAQHPSAFLRVIPCLLPQLLLVVRLIKVKERKKSAGLRFPDNVGRWVS